MNFIKRTASMVALAGVMALPISATAQSADRQRAEAQQTAIDHHHHTGAKIVGGSAVGGAVVGGLLGGPKGALIGAGAGAAGGAVVNHVRHKKAVKKRERREYGHTN